MDLVFLWSFAVAWQEEAPRSSGGALLKVSGMEAVSCRRIPVRQPERAD